MARYVDSYIYILEKYYILSNGEIIKLVFLLQQSFQMDKDDQIVYFTGFEKLLQNDTLIITAHHVSTMIKQHDYANSYMSILGD